MSAKRIQNLDFIRAFAIVLVLYYHTSQMMIRDFFPDTTLFYLGHHGVTIFFVLSGFLIGGIYYKKASINAFQFWISRFLRTYPPYLIMLFISWFSVYLVRKESFDFGYLFTIQNFYHEIPYFLVSWSLAVEEHFYLLFALLILAIANRKLQLYFWLICFIAPPFFRYFLYTSDGTFGFYKTASFLHIDSLAIGVILAYVVQVRKLEIKVNIYQTAIIFVAMISLFYLISKHENIFTWSLGLTAANLFIGGLILCSYYLAAVWLAKFKFIKLTALMAYSLYLVHPLVIHACMLAFKKFEISQPHIKFTSTLILIYLCSYVFYILVEKKSIEFRNRFLAKRYNKS